MDKTKRNMYGMLCGVAGIIFNIMLFAGKLFAGTISGAISITADAFNNLSDAGSSLITLVGFKMASQQAEERGVLFIGPGEKVYSGMVVGQTGKAEDVEVNVCKTKHLSNTRSSGSDDALRLVPKKVMSLEQCMDFIDTDELLEVTPKNLRIRKKILDPTLRKRAALRKQQ